MISFKYGVRDVFQNPGSADDLPESSEYKEFMRTVDVLVMGRKTYEVVSSFDQWPYGVQDVLVLSSKSVEIPAELSATVSCSSETPLEICHRLEKEGKKRLYIDGGVTVQRFLQAGLITDFIITTIPVIIGQGTPLFSQIKLDQDINLKLTASKNYEFGFVQSHYDVIIQADK